MIDQQEKHYKYIFKKYKIFGTCKGLPSGNSNRGKKEDADRESEWTGLPLTEAPSKAKDRNGDS